MPMLLMNIHLKITPAEYLKLGLMLQPVANETKWRIQNKVIHSKVEYLVIFEFMQTFNYNKFDFKNGKKDYNFSIRISTAMAILNFILDEVFLDVHMIEERSVTDKLNRALLNYGITF